MMLRKFTIEQIRIHLLDMPQSLIKFVEEEVSKLTKCIACIIALIGGEKSAEVSTLLIYIIYNFINNY